MIFRQLLERPAPTPRLPEIELGQTAAERPKDFFDPAKPPPDNAPIADLVDYWTNRTAITARHTDAVRERLLSACETDPRILDRLVWLVPDSKDAAERIVHIYQSTTGDGSLTSGWRFAVELWLKFNSNLFENELAVEAEQVKDHGAGIQNEGSLTALARVDPESAKPILLSLLETGQVRTETLATAQLFRMAVNAGDEDLQSKHRSQLLAIASNNAAPGKARDLAIEGLLGSEWSGRDDLYLSLFGDESLTGLSEGDAKFDPLVVPLRHDPDKWIPLLAKMVEDGDLTSRQNAAESLLRFVTDEPRRDAILPLLPWLEHSSELELDEKLRTKFIHALDQVEIPECVPGLIRVVYREDNNRQAAASVLAHYRDERAGSALLTAFYAVDEPEARQVLIDAVLACNGLSEANQLRAVEAYAAQLATPQGRDRVSSDERIRNSRLPLIVIAGKYLAAQTRVPDALAQAVLERADDTKKSDPDLSNGLLALAHNWQVGPVDLDLLRRIREGTADAGMIALALEHRALMRERVPFALQSLAGAPGYASGVVAVLAADELQAGHILSSSELEPTLALLICARLVQQPLPVRSVVDLLNSKNKLLATAAERYLLAEDSRDAREALWKRFPLQAYITGWREPVGKFSGQAFDHMNTAEKNLQQVVLASNGPPREIYALLDTTEHPSQVLRIYRDHTVYTWYENETRYREGPVTVNDLTAFRKYIAGRNLTVTGPQIDPCPRDACVNLEFLAITKGGGRRTLVQSNFFEDNRLDWRFRSFDANVKTHYRMEKTIKGVEVLIDDPAEQVQNVWQQGNDLRVRIKHEKTDADRELDARDQAEAASIRSEEDEEDSAAQLAIRHRQVQRAHQQLAWYGLHDGRLTGTTDRPWPFMSTDETDLDFDDADFSEHVNRRIGQATAGSITVLAYGMYPGGLWLKAGVSPARLVSKLGTYRDPVISPDGQWAVVTRLAAWERSAEEQLIRVELSTGKEFPVDLPKAHTVDAMAYVPALRRFVVYRTPLVLDKDDASVPPAAGYYLLDPTTGNVQPVSGDFEPLLQTTIRMLQPTSRAGEYWAAIPDQAKNQTQIGRYDVNDFSFHPILTLPHIAFDSMGMWVDETNGKIYIVIDGQLIRIPLAQPAPVATGH